MNFFRVNSTLKSYTYPIIKIIICCLLIPLWIGGSSFIHVEGIVDLIVRLIGVNIVIASVLCIYISFAEIIIVSENREHTHREAEITTIKHAMYSINEIAQMVDKNDIIDIRITAKGKIVAIGASSDCEAGNSNFFDKLFFVDEKEFTKIEDFEREIKHYSNCSQIAVVSIDGIPTGEK